MNLNRGTARPAPATTGATRSNVTAPSTHSGATRGSGLFGSLTRASSNDDTPSKQPKTKKPGDKDQGLSDDDQEVAKAKTAKGDETVAINDDKDTDKVEKANTNDSDSESLFGKGKDKPDTKPGQDDDMVKKAAGDGGDFKPMGGDHKNPWDANSDKGENPAPNSTGAPNTPSGL